MDRFEWLDLNFWGNSWGFEARVVSAFRRS
jgi:hypothetical protein